ncbi:MAG TPA: YtxH domain-containing protein [Longimicrobiales bacterium]|nr:YtxH domain-containing protein [Longimicrobiales bacterium]
MEYDESPRIFNVLTGFALGVVVGAGIALLLAPESGKRTRKRVLRIASDARSTAGHRLEDLSDEARALVKSGRKRLGI